MIKHFKITQSNSFVISLQCLKKDVDNGVYFLHADKYKSLYKLGLLFLMEAPRYVESTKNQKLVIFLQYIKECHIYCDPKHSDILCFIFYLFPCTARL